MQKSLKLSLCVKCSQYDYPRTADGGGADSERSWVAQSLRVSSWLRCGSRWEGKGYNDHTGTLASKTFLEMPERRLKYRIFFLQPLHSPVIRTL